MKKTRWLAKVLILSSLLVHDVSSEPPLRELRWVNVRANESCNTICKKSGFAKAIALPNSTLVADVNKKYICVGNDPHHGFVGGYSSENNKGKCDEIVSKNLPDAKCLCGYEKQETITMTEGSRATSCTDTCAAFGKKSVYYDSHQKDKYPLDLCVGFDNNLGWVGGFNHAPNKASGCQNVGNIAMHYFSCACSDVTVQKGVPKNAQGGGDSRSRISSQEIFVSEGECKNNLLAKLEKRRRKCLGEASIGNYRFEKYTALDSTQAGGPKKGFGVYISGRSNRIGYTNIIDSGPGYYLVAIDARKWESLKGSWGQRTGIACDVEFACKTLGGAQCTLANRKFEKEDNICCNSAKPKQYICGRLRPGEWYWLQNLLGYDCEGFRRYVNSKYTIEDQCPE